MLFGNKKNKETVFKPVFNDVVRATPFYLDSVNIFDISNRKFLDKISVRLSKDDVREASLYKIFGKKRRFKVAIVSLFDDVYAVCYLTARSYRASHANSEESDKLNKDILYHWCLKRAAQNKEEGYIYSPNCSKRAMLTSDGVTKVEMESLCLFPKVTATVPKGPEDVDKFVWIFEHEKTSFYGDKTAALTDLENHFKKF